MRAALLDHRGELLPKCEVLQQQFPPRTNEQSERPDDHRYKAKHGRARLPGSSTTVNDFIANGVLATDTSTMTRIRLRPEEELGRRRRERGTVAEAARSFFLWCTFEESIRAIRTSRDPPWL